jgi:hypothetical protein
LKNLIKPFLSLFLLVSIISSCSKSDDGGDSNGTVDAGEIEAVITLVSPLENWNFGLTATMTPKRDLEDSKITYVNTPESRNMGINIPRLELDESIHTITTSSNAHRLQVFLVGRRLESEGDFNIDIEIFLNGKSQHKERVIFTSPNALPGYAFDWSIEEGFKEI